MSTRSTHVPECWSEPGEVVLASDLRHLQYEKAFSRGNKEFRETAVLGKLIPAWKYFIIKAEQYG